MLTLEHVKRVGEADIYRLFDDAGYEDKFTVTAAERATDPEAGELAFRRAVERYRFTTEKAEKLDG
jgi:hypothetical protein